MGLGCSDLSYGSDLYASEVRCPSLETCMIISDGGMTGITMFCEPMLSLILRESLLPRYITYGPSL